MGQGKWLSEMEWNRWDKGNGEPKGSGTDGIREMVNLKGVGDMENGKW